MDHFTALHIEQAVIVRRDPESPVGILEKVIYKINIRLIGIPQIEDLEFLPVVAVETTVRTGIDISGSRLEDAVDLRTSKTALLIEYRLLELGQKGIPRCRLKAGCGHDKKACQKTYRKEQCLEFFDPPFPQTLSFLIHDP